MGVFTSTKQFRLGLNLINPWWLSGSSVDLDLANGRYYDSSLAALKQPLAAVTDYLSCTRASIGYAKTAAGVLTQFPNNALRLTDRGLLVEDARTNDINDSQNFAAWGLTNVTTPTTITAPDGSATAYLLKTNSSAGTHLAFHDANSTLNGSTTFSCYLKAAGYNFAYLTIGYGGFGVNIKIAVDLVNAVVTDTRSSGSPTNTSNSVEQLANGWVRLRSTMDIVTSVVNTQVGVLDTGSLSGNGVFTGDGASGIYAWGAQVELGAFATSYIPTTSTGATRAADNITITGAAQTLIANATASIVAQVNNEGLAGVAANAVDSNGTDLLGFDSSNHGLASITATLATANSANRISRDKIGLAWSGAGRSLVLNGGTVATDASAQTPSATQHLGSSGSANFLNGIFERLTIWNSKLADATLQGFTAL